MGFVALRSPVATPWPSLSAALVAFCVAERARRLFGINASSAGVVEDARDRLFRVLRTVLERLGFMLAASAAGNIGSSGIGGRFQVVADGVAIAPRVKSGVVAASTKGVPGSTATPLPLRACCGGSWYTGVKSMSGLWFPLLTDCERLTSPLVSGPCALVIVFDRLLGWL